MPWICNDCGGEIFSKETHKFDSSNNTYFYEGYLECDDCGTQFDWDELEELAIWQCD